VSDPVLRTVGLELRPIETGDAATILRILRDPTVARWWGDYDEARVASEFFGDADEDGAVFLIVVDGESAGLIQYSEETDPMYRHAGIDISVMERHQGKGVGPAAIRLLARHLFEERGHHRLTIDPAAANRNAIRAYETVGFRPVGVMRKYERGNDGTWHDGLLMDLLAEEFEGQRLAWPG
jgi:aminoglycoside 6'-N-acetyltransferase